MKKVLSSLVAVLAALCYSAVAGAVPATGNVDQAISVIENEHQGATVKPAKKPKKVRKSHKAGKKKAAPASTAAPATTPPPAGQ
jgi:hypothetical protein